MEEKFIYSPDFFIERSALTVTPFKDDHLTDFEYLRLITRMAVKCNIKAETEESDTFYRTELYFSETVISGEYVDDWLHILRASDMYTVSVVKSTPQTVKVSCFRAKR